MTVVTATEAHEHANGSHEEPLVPRLRVLPFRHTKVIHLIRHGQGYHNVAGALDEANYKSFEWLDAHLTEFGWRQALALNAHIKQLGSTIKPDVVIVSPLTRTLETAAGVFGSGAWQPGDPAPALMVGQTEVEGRRAAQAPISAAGCPPIVAWEGCREHLGQHPCDKRRTITEIAPSFPAVDFSQIEADEDTLWTLEHRETKEEIKHRGMMFMQKILACKERELAVVAHSGILYWMLTNFGAGLAAPVLGELHQWYENCEMRTVVVCDEGGSQQHADPLHFRGGHNVGGS